MSYSVELDLPFEKNHYERVFGFEPKLGVTTFVGENENKKPVRCVQLTIGEKYCQLTPSKLAELEEILSFAKDNSLADY